MPFVSTLLPGEPLYNDANFASLIPPRDDIDGRFRGYEARPYDQEPYGSFAAPFPRELYIPRSEWRDRIEEMERTKSRLSDLCDQAGLPHKDQGRTNYCWANGPVYAMECLQVLQNEPVVLLSPASVAAPIKNYSNVGGWGLQALRYIVQNGVAPVSLWPANAIDRRLDSAASRAARQNHKVPEWWELRPRDFDALMSCLLRRLPVPVAYNWWRHLVTAVDPAALPNGRFGIRIRNSWARWGANGYGVFEEGKGTPDEQCCPRVTTPGGAS